MEFDCYTGECAWAGWNSQGGGTHQRKVNLNQVYEQNKKTCNRVAITRWKKLRWNEIRLKIRNLKQDGTRLAESRLKNSRKVKSSN